jgi:hypothetical protein
MARELTIKINADGRQARQELGSVEKAVQGVETATVKVDKSVATMGGNVAKAVGVIGGAFAAANIGAEAKKAVDATSRIADAAQRMGIGTDAVQKLAIAARMGGSSLEAVQTAMGQMANILGDEKGGAKALAAVGLTFKDIHGLSPDQTFTKIADAIGKIPEPLRQADAARDIFGRGALELLPAMKSGFEQAAIGISLIPEHLVKAADVTGDRMLAMETSMNNLKARALIPFLEFFTTHLPEGLQVTLLGISQFMPSLEVLTLGIIAAGGPVAALGALKTAALGVATFFTGTLPGLFAGALTFFTTTLPAAISTFLAFIGPVGWIALGLIALAGVWYKWGDDISAFVKKWAGVIGGWFLDVKDKAVAYSKQLFEGVKTWLMDKLLGVVNFIKEKTQAVVGFFKDMYDKVVGHSIVPDMIRGITTWFGKLDAGMVRPTEQATRTASQYFREFADSAVRSVSRGLADIMTGTVSFKDGFIGIWHSVRSLLSNVLSDILENVIGGFVRSALGKLGDVSGAVSGMFGGGSGGGGGAGGGQSMSWQGAAVQGGMQLLDKGIDALTFKLSGGQEAQLNPARDAFFQQFGGPGFGDGSAYVWLGNTLNRLNAGYLSESLRSADEWTEFRGAASNIVNLLTGLGIKTPFGTDPRINFHRGGLVPGMGEVPATLLGGERVLSRTEAAAYDRGGMTINGGVSITISGAGKNAKEIAEQVVLELPKAWERGRGRKAARLALGMA